MTKQRGKFIFSEICSIVTVHTHSLIILRSERNSKGGSNKIRIKSDYRSKQLLGTHTVLYYSKEGISSASKEGL
jgi:hypothetical protein